MLVKTIDARLVAIRCPGCNEQHVLRIAGPDAWGYNGNPDAPTFTPSLLTTSGHFLSTHQPGARCWCTYNAEHPDDPVTFHCSRCHSFITDGRIQFLGDCSHALANQTVPLLPFDDDTAAGAAVLPSQPS